MNEKTKSLDCYFFVDMDEDIPEEQRCIDVLCIECQEKHYPNTGWFHPGAELGYAEGAEWKCKVCGKILNYVEKSTEATD